MAQNGGPHGRQLGTGQALLLPQTDHVLPKMSIEAIKALVNRMSILPLGGSCRPAPPRGRACAGLASNERLITWVDVAEPREQLVAHRVTEI